jgi:hypothetical protein
MPELDDLILEAIGAHLPARGIEYSLSANGLRIPSLSIAVRVRDAAESAWSGDRYAGLHAIFQAGSIDSIGGGMEVLHTGLGESREAAAANAAHQWIDGVLPVIVSYIAHRAQPEVEHAQMVVAVPDTGVQFGWDVHLGPIVTRMYSDHDPPAPLPQNEIFLAILNALHPFAAHSKVFWLECFASRDPDGRFNATCRMRNDDWPEGREALLQWAAGWPHHEGFVTQRQFIILEPAPVDRELAAKLPVEEQPRKPWWRRLWS